MPELKIKCPYCNRITGTGFTLGEGAEFDANLYRNNRSQCKNQNCGKMITWDGEDVVNREDFA